MSTQVYNFFKDHGATLLVLLSIALSTYTNMAVITERIDTLEQGMKDRKIEVVEQFEKQDLQLMALEDRVRINEWEDKAEHAALKTRLDNMGK